MKRERYAYAAANLQRAFVAWGRREVALVNADPARVERVPEYLVQFHRRHLEDADALHVDTLPQDFMALVEDGWRKAWERYEGSQRGFAEDVGAAWRHLRRRDPLSGLGAQLRCVLTLSSIRTVGYNVPGELLHRCVRAGVLTARQAEHLGRLMRDAEDRAVILGRLAGEFEREPALRSKLFDEALTASQAIGEESSRARALSALAAHLPPEQMTRALSVAQAIGEESSRTRALSALAAHLPPGLMSRALAQAQAIGDHYYRAQALSALAQHLQPELMHRALAAAAATGGEPSRARALSELARHLPQKLMPQALAVAQAIGGESSRARALSALAAHLPAELLTQALAAARALGDESARTEALSGLAVHLGPELRAQALSEALNAAQAISKESARIEALSTLAPHLAPAVLSETLTMVQAPGDPSARVRALSASARHLPPELISVALSALLEMSARVTRPVLLSTSSFYMSAIRTHSGEGAMLALRRAILDTAVWYP